MRVVFFKSLITILFFYSHIGVSAKTDDNSNEGPLVIESQVKGSQEQPKVIYIIPWQGIDNPISIEQHQRKVVLPTFNPINPKVFRENVKYFHQKTR